MVIVTDCIGSCKSNYHTMTATTAPYIYIQACNLNLPQLTDMLLPFKVSDLILVRNVV